MWPAEGELAWCVQAHNGATHPFEILQAWSRLPRGLSIGLSAGQTVACALVGLLTTQDAAGHTDPLAQALFIAATAAVGLLTPIRSLIGAEQQVPPGTTTGRDHACLVTACAATEAGSQTDSELLLWLLAAASNEGKSADNTGSGSLHPLHAALEQHPLAEGVPQHAPGTRNGESKAVGKFDSFTSVWSRGSVAFGAAASASQRASIGDVALPDDEVMRLHEETAFSAGSQGSQMGRGQGPRASLRLPRLEAESPSAGAQRTAPHHQQQQQAGPRVVSQLDASASWQRGVRRSKTFSEPTVDRSRMLLELATITEVRLAQLGWGPCPLLTGTTYLYRAHTAPCVYLKAWLRQ